MQKGLGEELGVQEGVEEEPGVQEDVGVELGVQEGQEEELGVEEQGKEAALLRHHGNGQTPKAPIINLLHLLLVETCRVLRVKLEVLLTH